MASTFITDLYLLRFLTNLHAGSGDTSYGIVDKQVQRDPVDQSPVVHASGMKGALREIFDYHKLTNREEIFGTDTKTMSAEPEKAKAGLFYFFEARMVFLPVRSDSKPFFLATSPERLTAFLNAQDDFGTGKTESLETTFLSLSTENPVQGSPIIFNQKEGIQVDEFTAVSHSKSGLTIPAAFDLSLEQIALFHDFDLKAIANRLPVIARNFLENGISGNLWYEEIVPRETRFYTFVARPDGKDYFETGLNDNRINHRVQVGGNASVGCGLCTLKRF